jgi:hypothetical protein
LDRRAEVVDVAADRGARAAASLSDLVTGSDVLMKIST